MASTIKSVAHLSRDLGMTEKTLIREGIMEYIKACMRDGLEIMSRYQVLSLDEFEKRVQDGSIPEHPGWEDLITLENIENSMNILKMELSHVILGTGTNCAFCSLYSRFNAKGGVKLWLHIQLTLMQKSSICGGAKYSNVPFVVYPKY